MANRVLRDTTYSETINKLSPGAEVFFYRLIMKADDFGSFHANPRLVGSLLFPLKKHEEALINDWMDECISAGLIFRYTAQNKPYCRILNFNQRLRNMRSRFPGPTDAEIELAANCCNPLLETETQKQKQETEIETEVVNVPFDDFWNLYDKKVGEKGKLFKKWLKLTDKDRISIMAYIPSYLLAQPDKKYRKNPETFLNNKSWNDEIINANGTKINNNNQNSSLGNLARQSREFLQKVSSSND